MNQYEELRGKINSLAADISKLSAVMEIVKDLLLPKYGYVDENMPDWARGVIQKLVDRGIIKGDENGNLQLSYNDLRYYVVNDRAGVYGE